MTAPFAPFISRPGANSSPSTLRQAQDAAPRIPLKQGVGRLIRAESDRGVMAILDSRINTARYGSNMIASLPPARRTTRFEDVAAFFAEDDGTDKT